MNMWVRARTFLLLPSLVALMVLGPQGALAGPTEFAGSDEILTIRGLDVAEAPSAAAVEDFRTLAVAMGVSTESVIDEFGGQDEFARLVSTIEKQFSDQFAGAAWTGDGAEADAVLHFTTEIPGPVIRLVEDSSLTVKLVPGSKISLLAAERMQSAAYQALLARPEVANAVSNLDAQAGTVDFVVQPTKGARVSIEALTELVDSSVRSAEGAPLEFVISLSDESVGETEAIRGGIGHGGCTGAFAIKSGGTSGVSTAKHCSAVSFYDGAALNVTSTRVSANSDGDVRWTPTSTATASASFQYRNGLYRTATSALNPTTGMAICKWGVTAGYACDVVSATGVCGNGYCGLMTVFVDFSSPGDSGGPWFNGTVARGVHHGDVVRNGVCCVSAMSRIGVINLMNAVVATG